MSNLAELGVKFPCEAEGIPIEVDDQLSEMVAGDVMQAQWTADKDISIAAAFDLVVEVLKIKEEYPYFVLHYVRVDKRLITMQFSVAPVGKETPNPGPIIIPIAKIVALAIALIAAALAAYLVYIAAKRGYLLPVKPPMGNAQVLAMDMKTMLGLPNVTITVAGRTAKTGAGGAPAFFKDLVAGVYTFTGQILTGYQQPDPKQDTIQKDQTTQVTIQYWHDDQEKPNWGYLTVYTHPIVGEVTIGGVNYGPAPVGPLKLTFGTYGISFSYVEGWVTPIPQIVTLDRGQEKFVTGFYTKPLYEDGAWWEQYLRPVLIAGGVLIGAAVVVPEVIRAVVRRGEK